ncbi:hypothetical protein XCR1_2930006 [Xenorhabdus cabanillasii JM26]|uniref:Uncharacterized protein n=1 Tax=Xenorhabdus cabanillasii JM26 TaxID=1427517 RepID=W1J6B3_9GAMM|nr:hypothetical protein XCR1_2930006 [Xenorhabdus cabanillasii JM26]
MVINQSQLKCNVIVTKFKKSTYKIIFLYVEINKKVKGFVVINPNLGNINVMS